MQVPSSTTRYVLAFALPLLATGCGSGGPTRYEVTGTVTYQGENVPTGTITFTPASGEGGAIGIADITNGEFETQSGKGVPAGKYVALVRGYGEPGAAEPGEGLEPPKYGPKLFDEVSIPIDLPAENSTHTFELPLGD